MNALDLGTTITIVRTRKIAVTALATYRQASHDIDSLIGSKA